MPGRWDDPESHEIPVPEEMEAICPKHGFIATVLIGHEIDHEGLTWVVRCGYCGKPCELERKRP